MSLWQVRKAWGQEAHSRESALSKNSCCIPGGGCLEPGALLPVSAEVRGGDVTKGHLQTAAPEDPGRNRQTKGSMMSCPRDNDSLNSDFLKRLTSESLSLCQ